MRDIFNELEDLQKDNMVIDNVNIIAYKFKSYEIKGEWIYGNELSEKINYESIFKKNNKVVMILKLLKIGKILYEDDEIKKTYCEDYKMDNKIFKKPRIEVDIETLNDSVTYEIYDFFKTYGIIGGDRYNLRILLRKIIEFYCTVKILESINKQEINTLKDEMLYVLYPEFRKKEKEVLSEGIAFNIQEKRKIKD